MGRISGNKTRQAVRAVGQAGDEGRLFELAMDLQKRAVEGAGREGQAGDYVDDGDDPHRTVKRDRARR